MKSCTNPEGEHNTKFLRPHGCGFPGTYCFICERPSKLIICSCIERVHSGTVLKALGHLVHHLMIIQRHLHHRMIDQIYRFHPKEPMFGLEKKQMNQFSSESVIKVSKSDLYCMYALRITCISRQICLTCIHVHVQ